MKPTPTARGATTDQPWSPQHHLWSAQEHVLLVRRMGQLQQQMTQLVNAYEAQLSHWKHRLMRQSIRLMLARTRSDWGLLNPAPDRPLPTPKSTSTSKPTSKPVTMPGTTPVTTPARQSVAAAETEALICKTGCVMDHHHWRDGDQCLRTGMACQVATPAQETARTAP